MRRHATGLRLSLAALALLNGAALLAVPMNGGVEETATATTSVPRAVSLAAHTHTHEARQRVADQKYLRASATIAARQHRVEEAGRAARAEQRRRLAKQQAAEAQERAAAAIVGVGVGVGGDCAPSDGEQFIIQRESGGSVTDWNPIATDTGHAFGLGQLTTENRVRFAARLGVSPDTTDYCAQLQMMRMYISERYGSTGAAVAFWQSHRWY